MPRAAFSQIVNRSMSEVLLRSMITGASAVILVLSLLTFGGETLRDFAFALLVGILSGFYSSIFIAAPVLTHWKARERAYQQRAQRIRGEFGGVVPAYAVATVGGAPVETAAGPGTDAPGRAGRRRRGRIAAPDEPEEISPEEFDELVRGIQPEGDGQAQPERGAQPQTEAEPAAARPSRTSSTGGVKPKKPKQKRPRNRRHGRPR
jgi:SecD/SecF fusion protein